MRKLVLMLGLIWIALHTSSAMAQSWKSQASMKLKRSEPATVEYKGELYVFNGFSTGLFVGNSVEKYTPNTKKWTLLSNTSVANGTAVTHSGIVRVGADVWLVGGRIGAHPGKVTTNVWIYNLNSKQWRKGPSLPKPMAGGGAAIVNNKLYTFGGVDAQAKCDVNYHYVLDLKAISVGWKNLTSSAAMPLARNHFSTVVLNNQIYAIGGQHGHDGCPFKKGGNVAYVHKFNPANNQWSRVANLPTADSHNEPGSFTHNGFIYTVGGTTPGNAVTRYNSKTNKWTKVATLPEKLVAPVARMYNNTLMVAGGGAPITAKSITTVRTLTSNVFNDSVGGVQTVPVVAPEPEPIAQPKPEPEPEPEPSQPEPEQLEQPEQKPVAQSDSETAVSSQSTTVAGSAIQINGNQISWPDDGWYQVQREGDFVEVCAGGISCEVEPGDYLIVNHTTGERFRHISIGSGNSSFVSSESSSNNADSSAQTSSSPVVVSGNTISWPDNGWYQVQDERQNYKEICGGGRTCDVANGVYTVINHTIKVRYEGIVVGLNADYVEFESKLTDYEAMVRSVTGATFVEINQQYASGALTKKLAECVHNIYGGSSAALAVSCPASETSIPNVKTPVLDFAYAGSNCAGSISQSSIEQCLLQSAHLHYDGLNAFYQSIDNSNSSTRYFIFVDEPSNGDVLFNFTNHKPANNFCLVQTEDGHTWQLSPQSPLSLCEDLVARAFEAISVKTP